ncbi:MAG: phosphohistidine phosphatase SixA [Oceanospirillaceae bacterium]|uniref:phosphohistidine phosphatase SixA n=1 Tax=unclassified Thalassolituus TaxID=2624967 RepID=UPI000C0B7E4E|nr:MULTISPECIES: phosphohistidine phosphatase SixA [unclassified Thalassolituus]MAK91708.1 phosphohistidine phosphatase SixA [Thalassolituus sp.]MAX97825.1 phosphohistidine phosphatase SixA [Oceanospirillaceae bacterium]MBL34823.1 phosphohistidine phosphatase SixA [Oceanospirillaceae bacterium]MBS53443.1 phosphohistidine phosphatase SixA [Oceanospirillaceae bacterium]
MKIYIVRHGSAIQGAVNDSSRSLSAKGEKQAKGAAAWLKEQVGEDAVQILASPFQRTMQTAAAISEALGTQIETSENLTPDANLKALLDDLTACTNDLILVSHLPLVGHLAAVLVDGEIYDQPWSPAEVWQLEGDIAASGCMTVKGVWYPVLDGI